MDPFFQQLMGSAMKAGLFGVRITSTKRTIHVACICFKEKQLYFYYSGLI
jgi:hypothetical protein